MYLLPEDGLDAGRPAFAFTSLQHLAIAIEEFRPQWLVSIVDPATTFEIPTSNAKRLLIEHHDISVPIDGYVPPNDTHIRALIEFGARRHEHDCLLVHCQQGRSRSASATLIFLAQSSPGREVEVAKMLRAAALHCTPNRLMVEIADRLLGCSGRLIDGLDAMGEPRVRGLLEPYFVVRPPPRF